MILKVSGTVSVSPSRFRIFSAPLYSAFSGGTASRHFSASASLRRRLPSRPQGHGNQFRDMFGEMNFHPGADFFSHFRPIAPVLVRQNQLLDPGPRRR